MTPIAVEIKLDDNSIEPNYVRGILLDTAVHKGQLFAVVVVKEKEGPVLASVPVCAVRIPSGGLSRLEREVGILGFEL